MGTNFSEGVQKISSPVQKIRSGELVLEGSKLNMHNALHITSLHKSTGINNFSIKANVQNKIFI